MRAIIIGAGNAGRNLAAKLCAEKYDVVVIDRDPAALEVLQEDLDVLTIEGSGSNPAILKKADIEGAELLVAVTNQDEVNILACICGRLADVKHRVARVSSPDFLDGAGILRLREVGVDLAVDPRQEPWWRTPWASPNSTRLNMV